MELLSVNIGQLRPINNGKPSAQTGIYKQPISGPADVTHWGLAGDAIADPKHHGGPDQAVYIYGTDDYAWWSAELGTELEWGTLGENLTVSELESSRFAVGDRLQISDVVLEVTAPRIPCSTLAARMGDPTFLKRFRAAERPGLYCRVIQAGRVQAGDSVRYEPYPGETVTLIEMFRDYYKSQLSAETLRRYLAAPIAIRDRVEKETRLEAMVSAGAAQ